MTEAMDPFAEYIPPDRMPAFKSYEALRSKELPDSGSSWRAG